MGWPSCGFTCAFLTAKDYLEFMLYRDLLVPDQRGGAHHLCTMVSNVTEMLNRLQEKPYAKTYTSPMYIVKGLNCKNHLSLFDPYGSMTEVIEPLTIAIDGKPPVPSRAPPRVNSPSQDVPE